MIERFYLKDYLSFKESELNFANGLVVFTGPSGSGKSILLKAILSSLGASSCEASLCESSVTWDIASDENGLEEMELNVFKHIKKEKSRYFINNQSIPKKLISNISSNYLRHLSLKDFSDFENENLLDILDKRVAKKSKKLLPIKEEYQTTYSEYIKVKADLLKVEEEEKKIVELKEFAAFEIKKIQDLDPKEDEDEELLVIKKELSKKEKVMQSIEAANAIFNYEHHATTALDALDVESSFFNDAMNELRAVLDNAEERFSALDEIDIEEVLNRIEQLSGVKRRYGSIQEALAYKEQKILELQKYENIEIEKSDLENRYNTLDKKIKELGESLTQLRVAELQQFTKDLNNYLQELYLRECNVTIEESEYGYYGKDEINITLNNTQLQKISTGEFNRLRLAILAIKSENMSQNGGVLMLDEIDANLSGEESMSVAKVLRQLAKHFQIFVISHQPQLTSMGNQHFLVYKDVNGSYVKELNEENRVDEIARIISGEKITQEAKRFAKELLEANRCVS